MTDQQTPLAPEDDDDLHGDQQYIDASEFPDGDPADVPTDAGVPDEDPQEDE